MTENFRLTTTKNSAYYNSTGDVIKNFRLITTETVQKVSFNYYKNTGDVIKKFRLITTKIPLM